ncbi:MAG TPA: GNAT family N-acetyltransferase [Candidatus Limnocylindria bacterium]|nr:GNAT family N-acetyltransferase [Candidatus Limnocylindria bacterium]
MATSAAPGTVLRRGELTFRSVTPPDVDWVADLWTARSPDEPQDPVTLRYWWANDDPAWTNERFVVERGSAPIGVALHTHAPWEKMPERYARVGTSLLPELELAGDPALDEGFDAMEERARGDGAKTFVTSAREDRAYLVQYLLSRGYREERRGKNWELDLVANRERLLAMREASRAKMRSQGVRILTLDRDADPDRFRKLHAMSEEAARDVPTTVPHVSEPYEEFLKWFSAPASRLDRFWIAREGDDVVGVSALAYPPTRGNVWTDWTATARKVRGRGIARALKLETVGQAIELGIPRVRTGNDGKNEPILHLNEEMGYTRIPGHIQLLKPA